MADMELPINQVLCGDCLKVMKKFPDKSVDLILTDLPYGVTQNTADIRLPLDKLWIEWKRLLKANGNVVLTAQFPYTLDIILSNRSWFRYDLIWNKVLTTGYLNANRMPLRVHEHILVFYEKSGRYYPQKTVGKKSHSRGSKLQVARRIYGKHKEVDNSEKHGCLKFPTSIITFPKPHSSIAIHPTEKPIELAEYIIKSYSLENDTILDCCMGVGWSAIASKKLKRNFIGIDINPEYVKIAKNRIGSLPQKLSQFI